MVIAASFEVTKICNIEEKTELLFIEYQKALPRSHLESAVQKEKRPEESRFCHRPSLTNLRKEIGYNHQNEVVAGIVGL